MVSDRRWQGARGVLHRAVTAGTLSLISVFALQGASNGSAAADRTIAPGESVVLAQSVDTPFVPPKPDIVLVIDRTGSMGPAIVDVKTKIAHLIATIQATEPDAQFAAVAYCDSGEATPPFSTISGLSPDASAVIDAVIAMPLCYGGDLPEAQLDALSRVGERGNAINFRPNSNRIIAWFGDAPGHQRGASVDGAISSLKAAKARVVAVSVGKNQLDATGQASRITRATGGSLLSDVASNNVAASLLQGLTSLQVGVTAKAECDDGLDLEATARTETVESGTAAIFDETLSVAADAQPGATLTCRVTFRVDGRPMGSDYVQEIRITVGSVSDSGVENIPEPEVSTPETSGPATTDPEGVEPPPTIEEPSQEPSPDAEPSQEVPPEQAPPSSTPTGTP